MVEGKKKVLVVIAHPDDETIFLGGSILSHPTWDWRILCATYHRGDSRATESLRAMNYYRSAGVVHINIEFLGHKDARKEENGGVDRERLISQLKEYTNWQPEIIISHNALGEYEHKAHIAVYNAVIRVFSNPWEIICDGSPDFPRVLRSEYWHIPLLEIVRERKLQIFKECYVSQQHLWDQASFIVDWAFSRQEEVFGRD